MIKKILNYTFGTASAQLYYASAAMAMSVVHLTVLSSSKPRILAYMFIALLLFDLSIRTLKREISK